MTSETGEKTLDLGDGLSLAYEETGDSTSSTVVVFFHGVFGVGRAAKLSPVLESRGVHFIAPTLPGWGNSSPVPKNSTYHDYLYHSITALLCHLHPSVDDLRIYLAGGSFGTVVTQILYGAPYDHFPYGRHIIAVLLLAPFSPPHAHKEFNQCLTWSNSLMIGSPAKIIPFNIVPRLAVSSMKGKLSTQAGAKEFIDDFVFKKMGRAEVEAFEKWKRDKELKDGEELNDMADGIYRSVQKSWEGLLITPSVFHAGWGGYSPASLDDEHTKPVFIVVTKGDKETRLMGEWLARTLKNATLRYEAGGHVGTLFVMDDIWADFMGRFA